MKLGVTLEHYLKMIHDLQIYARAKDADTPETIEYFESQMRF